MKHQITLWALVWMVSMSATAQNVTEQQALTTAQQFMQGKTFEATASSRRAAGTADPAAERGYYVFNVENNGGYVIVSADERTERPVLAYSTCGHFDYDSLPANAKAWMDGYTEGIHRLSYQPAANGPKQEANSTLTEGKKVGPLLTTEWSQETPYNNMCPMDGNERSVTGCVVTATAQIMRYHKFPAKGTGQVSYEWKGQTLTADLSQSTYQWDQMLNKYTEGNYTEAQGNAVALLMRDLGYASSMSYSSAESGTSSASMPYALWKYFGYDKHIRLLQRNYCTADDFNAALREEIDAGRPVLIGGTENGGHAFVCDGYDERGYFHMNYGWDGKQNDFYLIGPDMPFANNMDFYMGIQPNRTGTESRNGITGQSKQDFIWKEDNTLTCALFVISTICEEEIEVALAAKNTATNEVQYFIKTGAGEKSVCTFDGAVVSDKYKSFTFDDQIADGTYQLYPVCRMKGEQNWQTFYFNDKRQTFVDLKVEGGKKTYANNHVTDEMDPGKVEVDGVFYTLDDEKLEATVTFKNNRFASYKGSVTIPSTITIATETRGSDVGSITYKVVKIGKDAFSESSELTSVTIGANVKTIEASFYACFALKTIQFEKGSQLQTIKGYAFQYCTSLESIELPEGTQYISTSAFEQCRGLVRVVLPASIKTIEDDAFPTSSTNLHMYVAWQDPADVNAGIVSKCEETNTWTLHVPKGAKEKYEKSQSWKNFGTIVDDNTTAIQHLPTDAAISDRYYTLDGRELSGRPTVGGIYIVCPADGSRQGPKARKVIVK